MNFLCQGFRKLSSDKSDRHDRNFIIPRRFDGAQNLCTTGQSAETMQHVVMNS